MSPLGARSEASGTQRGSFLHAIKTVAWSFFGVRKGSEHENGSSRLNPVQVIVAGLIGAAVFVALLLLLVNWVVASGAAR